MVDRFLVGPDGIRVEAVRLDGFVAARAVDDPERGVSFRLLVSAEHVLGPYEQVTIGGGPAARARELVAALSALGISARPDARRTPTGLVLSLDEVERLLKRLS